MIEERFLEKIHLEDPIFPENGCMLWTGHVNPNGYGIFRDGNRRTTAHRWAYEFFNGPLAEGLEPDHLCRVRNCVNPNHLEAVTRTVNLGRGEHHYRDRTHCPRGHEYTAENTSMRADGGKRRCKSCERLRSKLRSAS